MKFGKTSEFSQGKLNDADEGDLLVGVGIVDGTVIVNFGDPISWIGMDRRTAIRFANAILVKARQL